MDALILNDVKWIDLPSNIDTRGVLTSIESGIDIPFAIKRIFYMHHIIAERGGHAHRDTDQVVIAIYGCFKMDLSDGITTFTFDLDDPTRAYIFHAWFLFTCMIFPGGCLLCAGEHPL